MTLEKDNNAEASGSKDPVTPTTTPTTSKRARKPPSAWHVARCPQLPDDTWLMIIRFIVQSHGLRSAKELRKVGRVSSVFARAARAHPDNNPPDGVVAVHDLPNWDSDSDSEGM